jgi:hypothetical protein
MRKKVIVKALGLILSAALTLSPSLEALATDAQGNSETFTIEENIEDAASTASSEEEVELSDTAEEIQAPSEGASSDSSSDSSSEASSDASSDSSSEASSQESEEDWGDIIPEDREGFSGPDQVKDVVWIPEKILAEGTVYTGSKVTLPEVRVYYGKTFLFSKTDYTLSYSNNVNAADRSAQIHPTVTVNLKGNYTKNSVHFGFTIKGVTITEDNARITYVNLTANGEALMVDPKLTVLGRAMKNGTDYGMTFVKTDTDTVLTTVKDPGVYDLTVTGIGNYQGSVTFEKAVQVAGPEVVKISTLKISGVESKKIPLDWDGADQSVFAQNITVKKENTVLKTGYELIYSKVKGQGSATVTVVGTGEEVTVGAQHFTLSGSKTFTYAVEPSVYMKDVTINMFINGVEYQEGGAVLNGTGGLGEKDYVLTGKNGLPLTEGKDFTVSYKNNKKVGNATAIFTGIGAYGGTKSHGFKVYKKDISELTLLDDSGNVISPGSAYNYTKGGVKPSVYVKGIPHGAYTVSYSNNKKVASFDQARAPMIKVKGKGNYTGVITRKFTIVDADISVLTLEINDLVSSEHPKKYTQTPIILDTNGARLRAGTDYDKKFAYTYATDVEVKQNEGTAQKPQYIIKERKAGEKVDDKDIIPSGASIKITVYGKGYYEGEISGIYRIAQHKISDLKFMVNQGKAYTYTGKVITPGKEDISVKVRDGKAWKDVPSAEAAEYFDIVSYRNNVDAGTAAMTLKGKGEYAGSVAVNFRITTR